MKKTEQVRLAKSLQILTSRRDHLYELIDEIINYPGESLAEIDIPIYDIEGVPRGTWSGCFDSELIRDLARIQAHQLQRQIDSINDKLSGV